MPERQEMTFIMLGIRGHLSVSLLLVFMPVCPTLTDFSLHFGCSRTVSSRDVAFLFCFCLYLVFAGFCFLFRFAAENNTSGDHQIDVVSSKICHIRYCLEAVLINGGTDVLP